MVSCISAFNKVEKVLDIIALTAASLIVLTCRSQQRELRYPTTLLNDLCLDVYAFCAIATSSPENRRRVVFGNSPNTFR